MKPLCHDCPHRTVAEGGILSEGGTEVVHGHSTVLHPCHNAPDTPCKGNARNLLMLKHGKANGDVIRVNQVLNGVHYPPKPKVN